MRQLQALYLHNSSRNLIEVIRRMHRTEIRFLLAAIRELLRHLKEHSGLLA
ncbi:hypothetical protein IC575_015814 [Cucumis melo]